MKKESEDQIQKVKDIRLKLDSVGQTIVEFLPRWRDQTNAAYASVVLSKMWFGKVLAELGAENPYPESKNPDSPVVEKTADVADSLVLDTEKMKDNIYASKKLRAEIDELVEDIKSSFEVFKASWVGLFVREALTAAINSGMQLGVLMSQVQKEREYNEEHEYDTAKSSHAKFVTTFSTTEDGKPIKAEDVDGIWNDLTPDEKNKWKDFAKPRLNSGNESASGVVAGNYPGK
jgi:hypothetical protein